MKAYRLSVLLALLCLSLSAQKNLRSSIQFIPLDFQEAKEMALNYHKSGKKAFLVYQDTSRFEDTPPSSGNFLEVYLEDMNLYVEWGEEIGFEVEFVNNEFENAFILKDATENPIYDAEVFLDGQKVKYNTKKQCYVVKKGLRKRKQLTLVVLYQEEVLICKLDFWKNKRRRPFLRIKRIPKAIAYRFRRWYEDAKSLAQKVFDAYYRDKKYDGYSVLNKPKYHPGDTIRLKAYITKKNGNPFKDPLRLKLNNPKKAWDTIIFPLEPGVYIADVVLSDSMKLQLNRNYRFTFYYRKKWRDNHLMSTYFEYEDYELDEVVYKLKPHKDQYYEGDTLSIYCNASYETGLSVPDTKVSLFLLANFTQKRTPVIIANEDLIIPDTIWTYTSNLSESGTLEVLVPDSLLPNANTQLQLKGVFSNSNGEIQELTKRVVLKRNKTRFPSNSDPNVQFSFVKDSVLITCKQKPCAEYYLNHFIKDSVQKQIIRLPYQVPINNYAFTYSLTNTQTDQRKEFHLHKYSPQIQVSGKHNSQSLIVDLTNPLKIPIYYEFRNGKKVLSKGTVLGEKDRLVHQVSSKKGFTFYYRYVWGGSLIGRNIPLVFYKNELEVQVQHPSMVNPGSSQELDIKVTNQKNKPVKDVQLTAGAINGQFKQLNHIKIPSFNYRVPNGVRSKYKFQDISGLSHLTFPINFEWVSTFRQDSLDYYKLRFPLKKAYQKYYNIEERDSTYAEKAMVAPFLVKRGMLQPIALVYLNRQLVYYYGASEVQPYCFAGQGGYNQITIRTPNKQYTLDSILLKKGQLLKLSIDLDQMFRYPTKDHYKLAPKPDTLDRLEQSLIKQKYLVFQPKSAQRHHIFYDSTNIQVIPSTKNRWEPRRFEGPKIVGPFPANTDLSLVIQGGIDRSFFFEPGFIYHVFKASERLYQYDWRGLNQSLRNANPIPKLNGLLKTASSILRETPYFDRLLWTKHTRLTSKGKGLLKPGLQLPDYNNLGAFFVTGPDSTYCLLDSTLLRKMPNIHNLTPGKYKAWLIYKDWTYLEKEFEIFPNTATYIVFETEELKKDEALLKLILESYKNKIRPAYDRKDFQHLLSGKNKVKVFDLPIGGAQFITGRITDENGEPLIGASILVKGTTYGTVTDIDGNYEMALPDLGGVLIISYTGFNPEEVPISGSSQIVDVEMEAGLELSEVVVTGYSVKRLKSLRASVAGVSMETIKENPFRSKSLQDIISDQIGGSQPLPLNDNFQLRKDFRDYGFWVPHLSTNRKGLASIQVTYPDNLTQWKTYVVGMDKKKRIGVNIQAIDAIKPLVSNLRLPRFVVEGDQVEVIGKSINYLDDPVEIRTQFTLNDSLISNQEKTVDKLISEKQIINVNPNLDSLHVVYQLNTPIYGDGEKRSIKVFKKGMEKSAGHFMVLEGDTTITLKMDENRGPVFVKGETIMLDYFYNVVERLIRYPHGCNEQIASKLIGNLMAKQIKTHLGQPFEQESYITEAIEKLENAQSSQGAWGWWPNNPWSMRMSKHVLKALLLAKANGYTVNSLEPGLFHMSNELDNLKGRDLLDALELLSGLGTNLDYHTYLNKLEQYYKSMPQGQILNELLTMILIKQENGLEFDINEVLKYQETNLYGEIFFNGNERFWYNNRNLNSLLAYRILLNAGKHEICKKIERFLLRNKGIHYWNNTFQTAKIVMELLPKYLNDAGKLNRQDSILINGTPLLKKYQNRFSLQFEPDQEIRLQKLGKGVLYLTTYQNIWDHNPKAKNDIFQITSTLLQNKKEVKRLTAHVPAELKVRVNVKTTAEYVAIEIPIPAGCSYGPSFDRAYLYRNRSEIHREYFRNKVVIYCRTLLAGIHSFTIKMEPRYTGHFTMNPAKAEEMYYPVFYGNNRLKKVMIKEE